MTAPNRDKRRGGALAPPLLSIRLGLVDVSEFKLIVVVPYFFLTGYLMMVLMTLASGLVRYSSSCVPAIS